MFIRDSPLGKRGRRDAIFLSDTLFLSLPGEKKSSRRIGFRSLHVDAFMLVDAGM